MKIFVQDNEIFEQIFGNAEKNISQLEEITYQKLDACNIH